MPQGQDVLLDRLGQRKFAGLGLVWKEQCPRFGAVPHCGTTGFHQPVRKTNVFVDQLAKILTSPEFFGPLPGEQSNRPRTVVGVDFLEIRRQRSPFDWCAVCSNSKASWTKLLIRRLRRWWLVGRRGQSFRVLQTPGDIEKKPQLIRG